MHIGAALPAAQTALASDGAIANALAVPAVSNRRRPPVTPDQLSYGGGRDQHTIRRSSRSTQPPAAFKIKSCAGRGIASASTRGELPRQCTSPAAVRMHVSLAPQRSEAAAGNSRTRRGRSISGSSVGATWRFSLLPQQATLPVLASAQEWSIPTQMSSTADGGSLVSETLGVLVRSGRVGTCASWAQAGVTSTTSPRAATRTRSEASNVEPPGCRGLW